MYFTKNSLKLTSHASLALTLDVPCIIAAYPSSEAYLGERSFGVAYNFVRHIMSFALERLQTAK